MSNLWLKAKFKKLVAACGGLDEASRACADGCRNYSVQQLSRCQTPGAPDLAPIDIVACLEAYCGEPIVSRAMVEARPAVLVTGEIRDEASEATESVAALMGAIRRAMADGRVDRREALEILAMVETGMEQLRDVAACLGEILKEQGQ